MTGNPARVGGEVARRRVPEYPIDEPAVGRLDDDGVTRTQPVKIQERRPLADPVTRERHVALLARQRRPLVVARPLRQLLLGGALEHDLLVVSTQPWDVQNGERVAQDADARRRTGFCLRRPSLTQIPLQLVLPAVSEHVGHEQLVDDE